MRLLTPPDLQQLRSRQLGPDALSVSLDQLKDRLQKSRRAIKVALLDQTVIAGVGNLYASELLHVAQVHPAKRCDLLSSRQWVGIHSAMVCVLQEAIEYEGSTLADGTYRKRFEPARILPKLPSRLRSNQ